MALSTTTTPAPQMPPEKREAVLMRRMFDRIAPRYNFITRAFSFGMDRKWKLQAVREALLPPAPVVLDLACGTGDFCKLVRESIDGSRIVAVDLAPEMLRLSRDAGADLSICGDGMKLPFSDSSFDAVFVGYGLRNFPNLDGALEEIARVTRPGGSLVSLDFFLPGNPLFRTLYLGYLQVQGAIWGFLLHGKPRLYTYIPDSIRSFVTAIELADRLRRAGFGTVHIRPFILGGIALHWAVKQSTE